MRICCFLLALLSVNAIAAPKFYGKMNFEMRNVDQDAEKRRNEVIAAATKNLPPRVGMIGFFKSEDLDTSIMYFGEMGYHTWGDDDDFGGGEVKLRLAGVSFENKYGKAVIGRHYPVGDLVGALLDPFVDTGVSGQGMDQYYDIDSAKTFNGIGYYSRYFQDAFTYKSPVFKGLQVSASVDNNSRQNTDQVKYNYDSGSSITVLAEDYSATYYSLLASYDFSIQDAKIKLYTGGVKGSGLSLNVGHLINTQDEERFYAAASGEYKGVTLSTYYASTDFEKYESTEKYKTTNLMLAASYKFDRNSVALSYSKSVFESPTDESEQDQIALGYRRHMTKEVAVTLNFAQFDINHDVDKASDNTAYSTTIGTALNF